MLGLKDVNKGLQGMKITNRIKHLKWQIQRAWRGYDDRMVFSMDQYFIRLYSEIMEDFVENLSGYPHGTTEQEWEATVYTMLGMLYVMGDDSIDDVELRVRTTNDFFELFSKHFYSMWD